MNLKQITKRRTFWVIISLILIILIKIFASNSFLVEKYFTAEFFSAFSHLLRLVTGWLPFSIGDILYFFAAIWLLYKAIRFFIKLIKNKFRFRIIRKSLLTIWIIVSVVYIIFNIFWGLNYNRKGITYQLSLDTKNYTADDLKNIQKILIGKVNISKQALITTHAGYPKNKELFLRASKCYQQAGLQYPFMQYKDASVKSSLFGWWGNYLGFTGYYNPFTGEAQVNTTVPGFVLPYTTCHEIAHQLGYAKEDEANFAGYLTAISSTDTLFHYSAYLDMFLYANRELYFVDSVSAKETFKQLSPGVKSDIKEWRDFLIRHKSFVDVWVTWAYGKYLKANQQPKGMQTYNEVIGDVIALYKKTGKI
ncbi:MAG: DUF3810 domain-containing protein [Ginsengibacter sp.]